jgi:hypothetical protein
MECKYITANTFKAIFFYSIFIQHASNDTYYGHPYKKNMFKIMLFN